LFNSKLLLILFANLAVLAVNVVLFTEKDKPVQTSVEAVKKQINEKDSENSVALADESFSSYSPSSAQFTPLAFIPLQIQLQQDPQLLVFHEKEKLQTTKKMAKQQSELSRLSQLNRRLSTQINRLQGKVETQYSYITQIEKENVELHQAEIKEPALIVSDVELLKTSIESKPDLIAVASSPVADKIEQAGQLDLVAKKEEINPFSGSVEFGFSYEQDNQVTKAINGRLILDYEQKDSYKINCNLKVEVEEEDGESTTEKYRWQLQGNYYLDPRNSFFARSDLQRSQFASYDREDIYTIGYGRVVFDQDKHKFSVELGPGYRMAIPNIGEDSVSVDEFIVRSRLIYDRILSKTLQVKMDAVLEAGHENSIYALSFSAQNKIYRELYLIFDFEYKYTQNVPIDTLNKEVTTGLNLLYAF